MSQRTLMKRALARAIEIAGGYEGLGAKLGISKQSVHNWDIVPPLRVLDVERETGVPRWELRPDLYPPESQNKAQKRPHQTSLSA